MSQARDCGSRASPARHTLVVALLAALSSPAAGQERAERGPAFYAPYAPGLLARPVTAAALAAGEREVELWDLLVGPGIVTEPFDLPGGAVLHVRSGSAVLTTGDQRTEIRLGQALAIDEGQNLRIDNRGSAGPLTLRATLIRAR